MRHELKTLPEYFKMSWLGVKNFEIRKNDRNFEVGDELLLTETANDGFKARWIRAVITYVTNYEQKDGYVVLALKEVQRLDNFLA